MLPLQSYLESLITTDPCKIGVRKNIQELNNGGLLELYNSDVNDLTNNYRGVIFYNKELIFPSIPFNIDLSPKQFKESKYFNKNNFEKFKVFNAIECSLIRVFYIENEWIIATNKKLNAYKSIWKNKSFGELFEIAIKKKNKFRVGGFF